MNRPAAWRESDYRVPMPDWNAYLLELLLGFWGGLRRHAERPERKVPYY